MTWRAYAPGEGGSVPGNYQRFFVPSIGAPLAADLIETADLQPGARVLDVACGTGVVTRLAAERVGAAGRTAGLDPNPGMLAVARAETPPGMSIAWHEADARSMPLPDASVDVVLCQMGLQFVPDRRAALREMHRVLAPRGRVHVAVPGPKPAMFAVLTDALARHLGPHAAGFGDAVFSLHDVGELEGLLRGAGFRAIDVRAAPRSLRLPPPGDFLWQYVFSTPIAGAAAQADAATLDALEEEVCAGWQAFVEDDGLRLRVPMTTASAAR